MNNQLQNYLKQMHEQGYGDDKIRQELLNAGWSQEMIDAEIEAYGKETGEISNPSVQNKKVVAESLQKNKEKKGISKKIITLAIAGSFLLIAGGAFGALYSDIWNPSWDPFVKSEVVENAQEQTEKQVENENTPDTVKEVITTSDYDEAVKLTMEKMVDDNSKISENDQKIFTLPGLEYSFLLPDTWHLDKFANLDETILAYDNWNSFQDSVIGIYLDLEPILSKEEIFLNFGVSNLEEFYSHPDINFTTMEELMFDRYGLSSLVTNNTNDNPASFNPNDWKVEEVNGLKVYTYKTDFVDFDNSFPQDADFSYLQLKIVVLDELNFIAFDNSSISITAIALATEDKVDKKEFNEVVSDIELILDSFELGPKITKENIASGDLFLENMREQDKRFKEEVYKDFVKIYEDLYHPTYLPKIVDRDFSGQEPPIQPLIRGSAIAYDCDGGGVLIIAQKYQTKGNYTNINEDEVPIDTLANGFDVYVDEEDYVNVKSPLGTEVSVRTDLNDSDKTCNVSHEELIKIIEGLE